MTYEKAVERRLAAILAADVAGYSRLMGTDEVGTLNALKAHRKELIDPAIAARRGRIVKTTGDGLLAEFPSAVDAVACAIVIQRGIASRNEGLSEGDRLTFRIGINVGDIIVEGADIFGDGVNVAARLETLAEPGGICISGTVFDQVEGKVGANFEDLGLQEVKNIANPVRIYRVGSTVKLSRVTNSPVPDKPSIAVLPLNDLSGDRKQQYFCDAVAEDLTTALSRFDWLFVAARNAAFSYRGEAVDIKQVSRELRVRYVLEGSVQRIDKKVRVNVQLVDAETLGHVWADRIDREMDDPFDLQDDIVARIASTTAPEVIRAEIVRSHRKPPELFGPWDHYVSAVNHYYAMTASDIEKAIGHLEQAVKLTRNLARLTDCVAYARHMRRPAVGTDP